MKEISTCHFNLLIKTCTPTSTGCFSNQDLVSHFCLFYKSKCWCSSNYFGNEWLCWKTRNMSNDSSQIFEVKCFLICTTKLKLNILKVSWLHNVYASKLLIRNFRYRQSRCLSVLDFWNVNLGVYYKLE